jgi:hypothetical protein
MTNYATEDEIRNYIGVTTEDFSDGAVQNMIESATDRIDRETGRTWQGIKTVTDEYYTGDGSNRLQLKNTDIVSIDSLSINTSSTGSTYTSVTTTKVRKMKGNGILELQPDAEVTYFPEYVNSTKVSYDYGNTTIPGDIKLACRYLVAEMMNIPDRMNQEMYREIISAYKTNRYRVV